MDELNLMMTERGFTSELAQRCRLFYMASKDGTTKSSL